VRLAWRGEGAVSALASASWSPGNRQVSAPTIGSRTSEGNRLSRPSSLRNGGPESMNEKSLDSRVRGNDEVPSSLRKQGPIPVCRS
jgi:hypothetical protein